MPNVFEHASGLRVPSRTADGTTIHPARNDHDGRALLVTTECACSSGNHMFLPVETG